MNKPIGTLRDGKPTGCLSGEGMEINVETWTGKEWIHHGTKYVPMSAEVRTKLEASTKPQVMSMGAVTAKTVEAAEADLLASIGLGSNIIESGITDLFAPVGERVSAVEALPSNAGREQLTELPAGYSVAHSDERRMEPLVFRADGEDRTPGVIAQEVNAGAFYAPGKEPETLKIRSWDNPNVRPQHQPQLESSGFNVNYYSIEVKNPKREGKAPYTFEVEDIIQAANLTFHEGNVLKSLIRSVNERNHGPQKAGSDYVRDAEKMEHSSREELRRRRLAAKEGKK